ncbi:MAG: hypothetical protein WCI36_01010 [bacterium]
MTTQLGKTPSTKEDINQTTTGNEQFTFRTMSDDLLSPPKISNPVAENIPKMQERLVENKIEPKQTISNELPNPFFKQAPQATKINTVQEITPVEKIITEKPAITEPVAPIKTVSDSSTSSYKAIIFFISILVISILSLGGYYFWVTSNKKPVAIEEKKPTTETIKPAEEIKPVVVVEKYSTSKPNFLVIDIATLTSKEIQDLILSAANEIKTKPGGSLYQFSVVDKNNNPISFPIFATASKLNFSPNLLATLSENFSIFLYTENNTVRSGLSLNISKVDTFNAELALNEKTFPTDLSFILLDSKAEIVPTWVFKDGSYGAYKTRYLNLNTQSTLSIDYSIIGTKFLLGTSKDTLRAILDNNTKPTATIEGSNLTPATTN